METGTSTSNQVGQAYPQTMTVSHKHELLWPTKLEKISEKDCVGYYKGTDTNGYEAEANITSLASGEVEIDISVKENGFYAPYVGKPNGNIIEGEYTPSEGFGPRDYFKAEMSSTIGDCHVEAPSTVGVPCSCPESYEPKIENGVCIACCKENGEASTTYDYDMDIGGTVGSTCVPYSQLQGGPVESKCFSDDQCKAKDPAKPFCDQSGKCIACESDDQCKAKDPRVPFCQPDGSCFLTCVRDDQCKADSPNMPYCGTDGFCAECKVGSIGDSQCKAKDPTKPYCDPTGKCFACESDRFCQIKDSTKPFCQPDGSCSAYSSQSKSI